MGNVGPEMAAFQEMSSEYAVRARQGGRKLVSWSFDGR